MKTKSKKSAKKSTHNRIDQSLVIVKNVSENPRRKGTFGFKSFQLIKNGLSVEKFVEKGGRMQDLRWDLDHKHISLKKTA